MNKLTELKSKVVTSLERIGKTNGHSAPESQDPIDPVLHEYYVAAIGENYFKKRREAAKEALYERIDERGRHDLDNTVADVRKRDVSQHVMLARGQFFTLDAHVKISGDFLDNKAVRVELLKIMEAEKVDEILGKCMKKRKPSVTYNVLVNSDANEY